MPVLRVGGRTHPGGRIYRDPVTGADPCVPRLAALIAAGRVCDPAPGIIGRAAGDDAPSAGR